MSNETMLLLMLASSLPIVMFAFCFAMVFSMAAPKFMRHPREDQLERTDKLWLALISPFHTLSSAATERIFGFEESSTWIGAIWGFVRMLIWTVLDLVMLPISILGGTIYMMGCIIWQFVCFLGRTVRDSGDRLIGRLAKTVR